eukprot:3044923-Amphidinium_carterae.1
MKQYILTDTTSQWRPQSHADKQQSKRPRAAVKVCMLVPVDWQWTAMSVIHVHVESRRGVVRDVVRRGISQLYKPLLTASCFTPFVCLMTMSISPNVPVVFRVKVLIAVDHPS